VHLNIVSNQQPTRLCDPHLPPSQTLHPQIYLQDKIQHLWHSSTVLFSQHRCSSCSHNETESCGREEKHQDVRGGSVTWSERTSETQLFVAPLELKLDSNLTNWTSCCFSMWSKRTASPLAVGSWWPQEVIHAISADAWERIFLLFGRITYVMYLKEWHSRIWIKPAFQGYCFYVSTSTCLFFLSFCFLSSIVWFIMFACLVGADKGPQSHVHVRIDTSILATYTYDCVYAYNVILT